MFDIGFSELFVIAVVALLVLGPERLPKAARFAGLWMRRARAQWYSVKSELENELAADELRRSLQQTQDELREAHARVQREGQALHREVTGAAAGDADAGWHPPADAVNDGAAPSTDTAAVADATGRPAPRADER